MRSPRIRCGAKSVGSKNAGSKRDGSGNDLRHAVGSTSGLILFLHPLLLQGVWLAWTWWIPISATLAFAVTAARPRPSSSVGPNVDATYPEPRFKRDGPNRS